jgi:glycerol-3-phosphate acyltransferase PlsY
MAWVFFLVYLLTSYLIGCFPSAYLIGKKKQVGVTTHGSRNPGMTNVLRLFGVRWGIICFVLDALKGSLVIGVLSLVRMLGVNVPGLLLFGMDFLPVIGFAAVIGHVYNVFFHFKGGKGVATAFGVVAVLDPLPALAAFIAYLLILHISKIGSLSSLLAMLIFDLGAVLVLLAWPERVSWVYLPQGVLDLLLTVLIVAKHSINLERLWSHQEPKIEIKKKK